MENKFELEVILPKSSEFLAALWNTEHEDSKVFVYYLTPEEIKEKI